MTAARFYSSTAGSMELQADITASSTTIQVDSTVGLPGTTPFTLVIDPGSTEEIVDCTGVAGTSLTVTRGVDGSPAQTHTAGAIVRHMATARDFREAQEHIGNTVAHGTTGAIVGTSDTQTLTNKNLTDASNTFPSSLATDAEVAAETSARTAADNAHAALTAAHGATGAVVGTTNTQTLSNKTLIAPTTNPSVASGNAQVIAGLASQTGALSVWKDSGTTVLASVSKDGAFSNAASNVGCLFLGSESTPTAYQAFIGGKDSTKYVLNVNGPTGQSADLLRLAVNGTRVAGFQADGKVDAPNIPSGGVAGTSTSKASKRLHWDQKTSVTLTGNGDATITHGAGFTPTYVGITPVVVGLSWSVDNITSTTFQVHFRLSAGGSYTTPIDFSYLCGE